MPKEAGRFASLRVEVRSLVKEWIDKGRFSPRCDAWLRGYDRAFTEAIADRGWIGMTWPRRFGGRERSNLERLIVTEELLRAGAPVAAHWIADRQIGPAILRYGSETLKEEFLPRIAAGELTFCLGMSETEAGSDLASIRTSATPSEGGWILKGAKVWTSWAHRAQYAYVLARTSTAADKHEGLSEFIVDMSYEGVDVRPVYDLTDEHHFNEVFFNDVFVPGNRVLGKIGEGWSQLTAQLALERAGPERALSTYPLFEEAIRLFRGSSDPLVLTRLARLTSRLAAVRRVAWDVAAAVDRGNFSATDAAMLKYIGTEFEGEVIELMREILEEEPTLVRDEVAGLLGEAILAAPGFSIRGGTSEILLTIIARAQLKS